MAAPIRRLKDPGDAEAISALLAPSGAAWADAGETGEYVAQVIARVREGGSAAVLHYARELDGADAEGLEDLRAPPELLRQAWDALDGAAREALSLAQRRIQAYHEHQVQADWSYQDDIGFRLGQRLTPLSRIGLYIPGGRAAYPSTLLMNAVPARIAGVGEIVAISPAASADGIAPAVLAAAHLAGVGCIYALGGAHGIALLAHGAESFEPVEKIVGPGNRFVTAAKRQLYGAVGIDSLAGPSEVAVIADAGTPPRWAALDLCAQAEHDPDARAVLFCDSGAHLDRIEAALLAEMDQLPRRSIISASLRDHGALIQVERLTDAVEWCNRMAPEHLQLAVQEPGALAERARCTGAVFLGMHACEALGDYTAGSNHVLPTAGTARFASPLGVGDFRRRTSVIECTPEGAAALAGPTAVLARLEGLEAHARAAESRLNRDE
ncbi:MAG: histidinol dehydrogenase [Gammaproteobacteria bacterium AqS3]|nr:histidinol dehydrogenase [Gammaproteobacteria bacterium AqS3]